MSARQPEIKLAKLVPLLEGELSRDERNALYDALVRLDAMLNVAGHTQMITKQNIRAQLYGVWHHDTTNKKMDIYTPDADGLETAIGAAVSGDLITLPPCNIAGNYTVPNGVSLRGLSRYNSILTGQITIGDGCYLETLSIVQAANSSSTVSGLVCGAGSGESAAAHACDIQVTQSGSGNAYAVNMSGAGTLSLWICHVDGTANTGTGHGVYRSAGTVYFYPGRMTGTTGPCNE